MFYNADILKIMMTGKIVGASTASVLYRYIDDALIVLYGVRWTKLHYFGFVWCSRCGMVLLKFWCKIYRIPSLGLMPKNRSLFCFPSSLYFIFAAVLFFSNFNCSLPISSFTLTSKHQSEMPWEFLVWISQFSNT